MSDGRRVYLVYRRVTDIFRAGERSISDAMRKGTAAWAVDDDTLLQVRAMGIEYLGVIARGTNDLWLATVHRWKDPIASRTVRVGSRAMRSLPLHHFGYRPGKVRI